MCGQESRCVLTLWYCTGNIGVQAREVSSLAKAKGWTGEVAATRKLTPGFRLIEKYSVLVGGCSTHRMDLSSMVMLKGELVLVVGETISSPMNHPRHVR